MSKALEALENIKSLFVGSPVDLSQQFDIIETALKEKEELEKLLEHERELNNHLITHNLKALKKIKALAIIKEKRVNVRFLISCKTLKEYNGVISDHLTQEEFDLLKEVLKK